MDKFAQKLNDLADYLYSIGSNNEASGVLRIKFAYEAGETSCLTTERCSKWTPPCGESKTGTILFDVDNTEYPVIQIQEQMENGGSFITVRTITGTQNAMNQIPELQEDICESLSGMRNGRPGRRYDIGELFGYRDEAGYREGKIIELYRIKDIKAVYKAYYDSSHNLGAYATYEQVKQELERTRDGRSVLTYDENRIRDIFEITKKNLINIEDFDNDYGRNIIVNVEFNGGKTEYHQISMPIQNRFIVKGTIGHEYCLLDIQTAYTLSEEEFVTTCFDIGRSYSDEAYRSSKFFTGDEFTAWETATSVLDAEERAVNPYDAWQRTPNVGQGEQAPMKNYLITFISPDPNDSEVVVGRNDAHLVKFNVSPMPSADCYAQVIYYTGYIESERLTPQSVIATHIRGGNYTAGLDLSDMNIDELTQDSIVIKYYIKITCGGGTRRSSTKSMTYNIRQ